MYAVEGFFKIDKNHGGFEVFSLSSFNDSPKCQDMR